MDRQDIDALLIGALYGELTPADEARLAAHLESHPTDRGALDDLRRARAAVRESRIFDQQVEPPQAVSALLLQEAHRRAPKRAPADGEQKESWFYRFTRVFLAHPAMAAAAMLVLVVGVAGTMYLRTDGGGFAEKHASAPAQSAPGDLAGNETVAAPAAEPTADRDGAEGATGAAGYGYSVQLDDNAQDPDTDKLAERRYRAEQEATAKRKARAEDARKTSSGMVVTTPERQPKDFESTDSFAAPPRKGAAKPQRKLDQGRYSDAETATLGADTGVVGGAAPSTTTRQRAPERSAPAQASPPPPPPSAAGAPAAPRPSPAKEAAPAPAEEKADAADSALIAWARREHNRTVALASKGDCRAAAKVAVSVQSRAPDYYAQVMATDRLLKKCQVYIAQERDAEAERTGKLRSKRVTSDEAAESK